ncbi:uncharacterized protein LOC129944627 [Eupeodes corollae]|uniref:uncharacterized protein LOC129944627 n=1 Tax=Eupeodes corollae TaxID=290404 RepID=UPI002491D8DE|nr:uncharacterized protein LOC129944627 [Eupeodes corollae]
MAAEGGGGSGGGGGCTNPIPITSCSSSSALYKARSDGGCGGGIATCAGEGRRGYLNGTGSLGRIRKQKSMDTSDDDFDDSQVAHIHERFKSDRIAITKPEEDRRRRTIIVEKKNSSFGFTLQSYGIHYKKEQEVEMITYVDYVEYDGPAYKAGMREGDVILSINGTDMEKADHKTLVAFIKNCDTRMRMVVLFEDCVRKVNLHMRYMQLQNILQSKMNELERICLRERELLEGKWKTHSLPARKKATTSPTDGDNGVSPTAGDNQTPFYRPTLSTEDVVNVGRHQTPTIIPPPAQFMLTYQYLDPTYRYVLKPSTSSSSGEYFISMSGPVRSPSEQHFFITRAESAESGGVYVTQNQQQQQGQQQSQQHQPQQQQQQQQQQQPQQQQQQQQQPQSQQQPRPNPPVPPPRTCEKHQHPLTQEKHLQNQVKQPLPEKEPVKAHKSRHCHGHSCNPCVGHFGRKSSVDKNGDNVSLDAYDLASPCCDTHCVPTRRRARHHKEHHHKHKHREKESKERPPRPKSQSHVSPATSTRHQHHHHSTQQTTQAQQSVPHQHQHQQPQQQQHQYHHQYQQSGHGCDPSKARSRYYDLTAGLASHCSLHSCTSSEFAPADSSASYTTSLSTDTLYWDPQSEGGASRQHSTKSRQSYHQSTGHQQQPVQHGGTLPAQQPHGVYQQRYHISATQVQPSQIYPTSQCANKPKSWDNLTTKSIGGYGFGYGYLDSVGPKPPIKLQIAQQRHSIPRKNPYGRYSTYTDVENYAPPPSQFVEELTTTTTTITTTKSTEELIGPVQCGGSDVTICDCGKTQPKIIPTSAASAAAAVPLQYHNAKYSHHSNCRLGYYSNLPRPLANAATSTSTENGESQVHTISEMTRL